LISFFLSFFLSCFIYLFIYLFIYAPFFFVKLYSFIDLR